MNLVNLEAQEAERRRQDAMTILEVLEGRRAELEKGMAALEGARILLRMAFEISYEYSPKDSAWLDYGPDDLYKVERILDSNLKRRLKSKLQETLEDIEDPLHEKRVAE